MKKIIYITLGVLLGIAGIVSAKTILVPEAPGAGQILVSTSTGAYISTTTDPLHVGSVYASSTTATSSLPNIISANINGIIYVDGNTYPKTQVGIQSAINQANANGGGTVIPYPGTYNLTSALTIKSGVHLECSTGTSTVFFLANNTNTSMITSPTTGLDDVIIQGCTFDGNASNQSSGIGNNAYLLYVTGSDTLLRNIFIRRNTVKNSFKHAIFVTGDNTINRFTKVIENNFVDNHGVGGTGYGIYVDYARNTTIRGNTIKNSNGNDAIEMGNQGEIYTLGNYVYDGQLQFPFSSNSTIQGNWVFNNTIQNDANTANNMTISDNHVLGATPTAGFAGISVTGASSTISNNQVVVLQKDGIKVTGGSGHVIIGNIVTGPNSASTTINGIYANQASNNIIAVNEVSGFGNGISLVYDGNLVSNNTVSSSTNGVNMTTSVSSGHVMLNNTIYGNNLRDTTTAVNKTNQSSATNHYQWNEGDATSTQYVNSEILNTTDGYGLTLDRPATTDNQSTALWFTYGSKAFNAAKLLITKVNGGGGQFSFLTGDAGGTGLTERVTMLRDGNVGVGNIAPGQLLNVQGTISGKNINGTSTTATSTFSGGVVMANGGNNVGIFTSTANTKLTVSLLSNDIASFHNGSAASGIWGINGGFLGQSSQQQITTNGSIPIVFFTSGTRDSMTAGIEWMRLTPTGSLGVGTTSPLAKLSVSSFNGTSPLFIIASSSTSVGTSTLFIIDGIGRVGMATTTPGSDLSIGNTGANTINISATATSTFGSGINIRTGCFSINSVCVGSNNGTVSSVDVSGGTTGLTTSGGPVTTTGTITLGGTLNIANGGTATTTFYSGGVVFSDASKLTQAASASSLFWDNTNLRLGIGNAAPASRLTVTQTSSGADVIAFLGENLGGAAESNTVISLRPGNLSTGRTQVKAVAPGGSDSEMALYTSNNNAAPTEKVRINDTGNVGIGTTTPQWKLQIASSTQPQLTLTDNSSVADISHWSQRSAGGYFYLASSSPLTYATSSITALSIDPNGQLSVPYLRSCDTIDTDVNGAFSCGTDSGGSGSGNSKWATSTFSWLTISPNGGNKVGVGIGTSSSPFQLTVSSSTVPQLGLTDGSLTSGIWTLRNAGGDLFFSTSSPNTFATTSGQAAFTITSGGMILGSEFKAPTSTSMTLNWPATPPTITYNIHNQAITITMINATNTTMAGGRKLVGICNSGSTAGALTWVGVEWVNGGLPPTQTTSANVCDFYQFWVMSGTSTPANPTYKVFGGSAGQNAP